MLVGIDIDGCHEGHKKGRYFDNIARLLFKYTIRDSGVSDRFSSFLISMLDSKLAYALLDPSECWRALCPGVGSACNPTTRRHG